MGRRGTGCRICLQFIPCPMSGQALPALSTGERAEMTPTRPASVSSLTTADRSVWRCPAGIERTGITVRTARAGIVAVNRGT
jgi:hypothetical protein